MEKKKSWSTHTILFILFLYFLSSKMVEGQNMIPIRVVVVLEMDDYGGMALNCISMALDDFYSTHNHYKTRLLLANRDSNGDVTGAAAAALNLLKNVEVQAIIGPMFSGLDSFLISLGQKSRVPIVTLSATSPSLTSANDSSRVEAVGAVVKAFGWREVVPINEFDKGIIPDSLDQVNAHIPYRSVWDMCIYSLLSPLASRLFTIVEQKGMATWDYAWIITDGITDELSSMNTSVIESMLGVKPYVHPRTKEFNDFITRYKSYDSAIAITAEKANIGNPKYQEANISRNSTTLKGLAGNFKLFDGQIQSPPYEIVKMVGPVARYRGYWTKQNGIFKERLIKCSGVRVSGKSGFEFMRDIWNSKNSTKVEGYKIDVFNAVMASLPIVYLVWALEHQINKYLRHPFCYQLGMTMWFAFSAFIFSHIGETVVQIRPG